MPLEPLFTELEQNIADDLSVERLAEAGLFSRSQLYREFYNATGHSVKEYVRKRRLSAALTRIRHSDMTLKQIAREYGFSSEQALCRSVKAATGQTPAQYRAEGDEYYFPAHGEGRAFGGLRGLPVAVTAETIPPTLRLRYYDSRLLGIEDRALARLFAALPGYQGRVFGRNGKQKGPKLCYELYIECDAFPAGNGFVECASEPALSGAFAKTTCPNREDEINAAWDYLYSGWLKSSMFTQAAQPYFEEYICAEGRVQRLVLYLPVEKRPGFHKIRLSQCEETRFLVASRSGANAEKAASQAVLHFLAAHCPGLTQTARRFYVSVSRGAGRTQAYTCGIALQAPLALPPGCDVRLITQPAGEYAVLEGDCCGDAGAYEAVLAAWVEGMGLRAAHAPHAGFFAVYEAGGSLRREDTRMKIYHKTEK
jgi:AraC-like DNA-binding protein/predicted transcriptional regulator YdeE